MSVMSHLNQYCDKELDAKMDGHHLIAMFVSKNLILKVVQLM